MGGVPGPGGKVRGDMKRAEGPPKGSAKGAEPGAWDSQGSPRDSLDLSLTFSGAYVQPLPSLLLSPLAVSHPVTVGRLQWAPEMKLFFSCSEFQS